MNRVFVFTLILSAALAGAGQALAAGVPGSRVGNSTLDPADGSIVRARLVFLESGVDLIVLGTATGLTPGSTYLSNIYDIDSVATGPDACLPAIFDPTDPDFLLPTMFLGTWEVDDTGVGRLVAINTNNGEDFVPLRKIGTVSIRQFIAPGTPPETVLDACGVVSTQKGKRKG